MKSQFAITLFLVALPALAAAGHDHHAHVHGLAQLEVAVEGDELHIRLESPLENLLGFEHAPRDARERAAVAQMREKLSRGDTLFVPTRAGQCRLVSATLEAPSLEPGHSGPISHADLDAEFRFTCAQPARLTGVEVRVFDVFPKLRRLEARVVSEKGQKALRLSGKMRFLSW